MTISSFHPVDARTLRQSVTDAIRQAILQGDLLPGAQVNQAQIAEQLGVSRGPVREALGQLQEEGLITNVPYKGTFVTEITADYIRELYDVRRLIETFAVRQVSESMTTADREEFAAIMQAMAVAVAEQNMTRFAELDVQFHYQIIRSARHTLLLQSWRSIEMGVRRCSMLRHRIYNSTDAVFEMHREILAAVEAGQSAYAADLIGAHISVAAVRVLDSWAELLGTTEQESRLDVAAISHSPIGEVG